LVVSRFRHLNLVMNETDLMSKEIEKTDMKNEIALFLAMNMDYSLVNNWIRLSSL